MVLTKRISKRRSFTKDAPPDPVFFVDADLSDSIFHETLARAGIRFERHDDHFAQGTDDWDWLAKAGRQGWVVLSHNKRIRIESAQTDRLMEAGVRAFMLIGHAGPNPPGEHSVFTRSLAENVVRTLPVIRRFLRRRPAPWIAKLYRPAVILPGQELSPGKIQMWLTMQQWLKER
ncbi:MAG TPA: hypothetical protein VFR31_05650 [Thermoanaerobaculia bacterium]|nr:hypothetical protein [Thermoanaerobaculia bacterium]